MPEPTNMPIPPEAPSSTHDPAGQTNRPALTLLVAMTPTGVIGHNGSMPWRLSTDLKRFKAKTMGGTLIMGRKTYDSIGRPLPGRRTIVVTRSPEWQAAGVDVASNPEKAVEMAGGQQTFVVGGAEIYRQLFDFCDEILLTRVFSDVQGDTTLDLDFTCFYEVESTIYPASARDDVQTEFVWMLRKNS